MYGAHKDFKISDQFGTEKCKYKFPLWIFGAKSGPNLGRKIGKMVVFKVSAHFEFFTLIKVKSLMYI